MRAPCSTARHLAAAIALATTITLAGCSGEPTTQAAVKAGEDPNQTLATAIGEAPTLTTVSDALSEAGLATIFDGPGSYTVLAPDDDAFGKLGDTGKALTEDEHRAELVAILRGHILPGHLTPDAIRKAIAARKGPVTVKTLAEGAVTFTAQGDSIAVAGSDGSKAKIDGDALVASNGVVLPLDGFIKKAEVAPAS